MKILKKLPVEQVVDVTCDICQKSCRGSCDMEFAELRAVWGYDSKCDGEMHECHMCEECYEKVVAFIDSLGGQVRREMRSNVWQTP